MFRYEYPVFKDKQLLKAEMLELLRDYPKQCTALLFQGYGNGIVNGCELTWNDGWLTVNSGVIHWNGNLYFMDQPYKVECRAEDQQRYLVVRFQQEKKQMNKVSGETSIYLRREPVRTQDEMELCRFRLQEGSRLRSVYKDFRDYSTEYDTINTIHAPYASTRGTTMNPNILMQYAGEMMENGLSDAFDISFVINLLSNDGRVSRMVIKQYVMVKGGRNTSADGNEELYQELLRGLSSRKSQGIDSGHDSTIQKKVLLV